MISRVLVISFLVLSAFAWPGKKPTRLWLIGDSTMSVKEPRAYPETGWGMPFAQFFDSSVQVINLAKNGRSTASFRAEGLWAPVMEKLQEGDHVFIQFGHNDEIKTKKTYTTPGQFKANLQQYCRDVKAKGGVPVLLTPVARRAFDSTGTIIDTHAEYAAIVKAVAHEEQVTLLDINEKSCAFLQNWGPQRSRYLFNHLAAGEHPNYPAGKTDDTHFNELGARKMASLVLAEIKTSLPLVAERIRTAKENK